MQDGLTLKYTKNYLIFTSCMFTVAKRRRSSMLVNFTLYTVKPVKSAAVVIWPPVTVVHTFT